MLRKKLPQANYFSTINDKCNIKFKFIKTNDGIEEYPHKTDHCCWWDRNPFDTEPLPIPIKRDGKTVYGEGFVCSFNCLFAFLLAELQKLPSKRDPLYQESYSIAIWLFERCHPGEKIKVAEDWRIVEKTGSGKIPIEHFRSGFFSFSRSSNIKLCSAQVYYQQSFT